MKLEIEVLDGPKKGQIIALRSSTYFGKNKPLSFNDSQMSEIHAVLLIDQNKHWNIECLAPLKLRLGSKETERIQLINGLIFHIGQTGFKVVERKKKSKSSWQEGLKIWLEANPGSPVKTEFFFFHKPIRLRFVQGIQYEQFYTLSYGPRILGYNNLDLELQDPLAPHEVVKFIQKDDTILIVNLCGSRLKLNNQLFEVAEVKNDSLLSINSTLIELSLL